MKRVIRWVLVAVSVLLATAVAAGVWLWNDPARAFALAMAAGHANAGVTERFVEIDGHLWRALDTDPQAAGSGGESAADSGTASAPRARVCLVLHGLGTSAEAMMGVAPILRDTHRVVVPDLPGFGEHPKHGDAPHDWRFYIDAIERFRVHEGLGTVDVVGTSMGGAFAAATRCMNGFCTGAVTPAGESSTMRRTDAG
jgi:hypothetical protein